MIRVSVLSFIVVSSTIALSNNVKAFQNDSLLVIKTVELVNEAINSKNKELVDSAFAHSKALFYGVIEGEALQPYQDHTHTSSGLAYFIEYWKDNRIDVEQEFESSKILLMDDGISIVKTMYTAFRDDEVTHYGTEYYTLIKFENSWKIISVAFSINMP